MELTLPIYRIASVNFGEQELVQGFRLLKDNRHRTLVLLSNLETELSPYLKGRIKGVNNHCRDNFETIELNKKLNAILPNIKDKQIEPLRVKKI